MSEEQHRVLRERTFSVPTRRLDGASSSHTQLNRPKYDRGVSLLNLSDRHRPNGLMCSWKEAQRYISRWEAEEKTPLYPPRKLFHRERKVSETSEISLPSVKSEEEKKNEEQEEEEIPQRTLSTAAAKLSTVVVAPKELYQFPKMTEKRFKTRRRLKSIFHAVKVVCAVSIKVKRPAESGDGSSSSSVSEPRTISSFFCQNRVNDKGEKEGYHLFFDKWNFAKENSHKLSLQARIAAAKPPKIRTERDVTLIQNVLNFLPHFKDKFTDEEKRKFGRAVWYLSCSKGRVVLRQGHPGTQFYVIITGRVRVQVDIVDEFTGDAETVEILHYGPGATFGELALLNDSGARTASVFCDESTELFQIDKDDFMDICYDVYAAEMKEKHALATSYALYSTWTTASLKALSFQSFIIHVPYGKLIEADWAEATYIYFILEGTVELLYSLRINQKDIPHSVPSPLITGGSLTGMPEAADQAPIRRRSWSTPGEHRGHRHVFSRRWQEQARDGFVVVGLLGPGECNDLRILSPHDKHKVEHLQMVSSGVKMLRFSARLIQTIGPKQELLEYVRNCFVPVRTPATKQLQRMYLSDLAWQEYKLNVRENTVISAKPKPSVLR